MIDYLIRRFYSLPPAERMYLESLATFIFIFYIQLVGKAISQHLVVVENLVSWFLPTGIKYCTFIFLPFRLWPAALITFVVSSIYLGSFDYNVDLRDWFFRYIYSLKTIFIFAFAAKIYRNKYNTFKLDQPDALIYWLICFCFAGFINGALISVEAFKFSNVSTYKILEFIGALAIGDFVGVLIALPVFILLSLLFNKTKLQPKILTNSIAIVVFVTLVNTLIIILKPELLYAAQTIALICLVIVIYKKGYVLGNITLFSINSVIVFNTYLGIRADAATPDQLFIVTFSLIGLFLGAAFEEQRLTNNSLEATNEGLLTTTRKLADSNKMLLEVNELNRNLAQRNTKVQEIEKDRISRDLHDEFGQQLTALKTNTHILSLVEQPNASDKYLNRINHISDELYISLKDKLSELRPKSLEHNGLKWSLENDKIAEALTDAKINLLTDIDIIEETLSTAIKIAIYRIIQEATNNTIKYASANNVSLTLRQKGNVIKIRFIDDGGGFDAKKIKASHSHGFTIMKERVVTFSGKLKIKSSLHKGTEIIALIKTDNI